MGSYQGRALETAPRRGRRPSPLPRRIGAVAAVILREVTHELGFSNFKLSR